MYLICIYTHVHTAYNYTFRIFRFVSFAELGCRLQRLRVEVVVQNWGNVPNAGESVRRSTSSNLFNILPLCFVQDSWNVRGHPHPPAPSSKKTCNFRRFPKSYLKCEAILGFIQFTQYFQFLSSLWCILFGLRKLRCYFTASTLQTCGAMLPCSILMPVAT